MAPTFMYDHQPAKIETATEPQTLEVPAETAPLGQKPEVIAIARKGLNAFIRVPAITQQLQQTCGLCGQWIASHRTVKRHYQYSHADVLTVL